MNIELMPCTLYRSSRMHYCSPSSRIFRTPFLGENSLNLSATIRQRQASWTRCVLGLFVVMWLNLALQSCAMAFGDLNDGGCLLCPPAHSGQLSSQSAHEVDHSDPGVSLCETSEIQCASAAEIKYDGSVARVKVKDVPSDVPIDSAPLSVARSREISSSALPDISASPILPGGPPPLNVLHCVYLI